MIAIVIPNHRFPLSADEEISVRHLRKFLGEFDTYMVGPEGLPAARKEFRYELFAPKYFASAQGYNTLLITEEFFRRFERYEYILLYQLDCLVFSNDLEAWCRRGWDYVGAPMFYGGKDETSRGFRGVGNGGLALRNVGRSLEVLTSNRQPYDPVELGQRIGRFPAWRGLKTQLHRLGYKNTRRHFIRDFVDHPEVHEDLFWSFEARRFVPDFRIPDVKEALTFAFECAPEYCFEANGRQLPFGCHAWAKWGRAFWSPYLLPNN